MPEIHHGRPARIPPRATSGARDGLLSTITVSTFYMIAQMVGAGALVKLLLPGVSFNAAVIGVGVLMIIYVVFGGMLATTWVQIIKAVLLMAGSLLLSVLVMGHFGFSFAKFFEAISHVTYHVKGEEVTKNFLEPGLKFGASVTKGWGPLDLVSLGLALVFGTAGLPHILVRFYTVPDAKTARVSVVWAMLIIGLFYIMTTFLGFGAATIPPPIASSSMASQTTTWPLRSWLRLWAEKSFSLLFPLWPSPPSWRWLPA